MYKHYSKCMKTNNKAYPSKMKTDKKGKKPAEQAYANYIGYKLMKAEYREPPTMAHNEDLKQNNQQTNHEEVIWNTLKKMDKLKTPGITKIPMTYYYWGGKALISSLNDWFAILREHSTVPVPLNTDIKIPALKYEPGADLDTKEDPENYRPIALQNAMYKLFDSCVKHEIDEHCALNNIILPNQGGFKKKEGTMEHLFVLQSMFQLNTKLYLAFLDLRKAYDTVWRASLIQKLRKMYNFPANLANTIEAMYKSTWSVVHIDNKLSQRVRTTQGLHQGALSSPILFNLYINDLIKQLNKVQTKQQLKSTPSP